MPMENNGKTQWRIRAAVVAFSCLAVSQVPLP